MPLSRYVSLTRIPRTDRFLLFQTLRGAVDMVPEDFVAALQQVEQTTGGLQSTLNKSEIEALRRRGYLTEDSAEHERDTAAAVMRAYCKNLNRFIDLCFRFPANGTREVRAAKDDIERAFRLATDASGDDGMIAVRIEIKSREIDGRVLQDIFSRCLDLGHLALPQVNLAGLDALRSFIKSENYQMMTLETDGSERIEDGKEVAAKIIEFFERQIRVLWRCQMDNMDPDEIAAALLARSVVRQKYPTLMFYPLSRSLAGVAEPAFVATDSQEAGAIRLMSPENEAVLTMLLSFTSGGGQISYNPFYRPPAGRMALDLGTGAFSFRKGRDGVETTGFEQIGTVVEDWIAEEQRTKSWEAIEKKGSCLACKYALVCGRDWMGQYAYNSANDCAAAFGKRIEQALPLFFFTLQGNWLPPATAEEAEANGGAE